MSIQPFSNALPVAEPAVQRRRAEDRDAGGEREAFVLPREDQARDASPPVRENAREAPREGGEPAARADDKPRSTDTKADAAGASERGAKAAETDGNTSDKTAEGDMGKTTGSAAKPAAPVAKPAAPAADVGALVSIAVAAEAEGQAVTAANAAGQIAAGKTSAATIATSEGKPAEDEVAAVGTEPPTDAAAIVVALPVSPEVSAQPVPGLALPIAPAAATAAADTSETADLLSGKAGPSAAATALSLAVARENRAATAANIEVVGEGAAGADATGVDATVPGAKGEAAATVKAPAPKSNEFAAAAGSGLLDLSALDVQAAVPGVATDGAGKTAQPTAQGSAPAAAQAAAPAEPKAIEALQQGANPIDLSALGQQGGARPEPARILTMSEPVATQTQAATPGRATSESQPTPLHVLPIEIGLRALAGARQFDIRLDPGELGRVDVNLSISDTGEVTARMVVDRVETLHLLQRDARTLERAFEQAGLKPSDAGVDITLRDPADQSGFRQNRQHDEAPQRARSFESGSETNDEKPIPALSTPVRRFVRLGGVDLSV